MGNTEGVKGAWRINFFIFLLTGSQSVLLPWVPIILKSAGIEAAATGLAVGLLILFSSLGIGITLQILRRTYSGAVRRIILLALLLISTVFYITSVFLIPTQNKDQSCYSYNSLVNIPANSLVGESVSSNVTVSSISDDLKNDHTTALPNLETSSSLPIILYTYPNTVSEIQQTTSLNNITFTNKTQGIENLHEKSTSPLAVTQTSSILNSTGMMNNVTTKNNGTITDKVNISVTKPNERNNSTSESMIGQTMSKIPTIPTTILSNNGTITEKVNITVTKLNERNTSTSESMIVQTMSKIPTVPITTLSNKHIANSGKDHGSENKSDKIHKNHKSSGRNVNIIRNSIVSNDHIINPEETNTTQSTDESLDNTNVDDNIEEYDISNYDQNYYQNYDLQDDSSLNGYYKSSNNINELNSFETSMQNPAFYNSYREINKPISTHNRKGSKMPLQRGSDLRNNFHSNQNSYPWSINSEKSLSSFQENINKDNKGLFGTGYYNQRPQKHTLPNVPSLDQYIKNHQSDQTYFPHHKKNKLYGVHQRQKRSPALEKDIHLNTSNTLIDSIKTKKDGLQIDISGETVKNVASAGIVTLIIIGGILGSGVEAAVAQLWHCYAHGYDEGGMSQDILERTITHTFHLSVYPQHKRWSTVTSGCWAVLGGMMSAIGCILGSSSGLWTGQAALHLALALLSFCILMIIPVPYGTVDPPRTRRPLSLYLDDEVLREGIRRLAFHGWVLISGVVSSISLTFGLWLMQDAVFNKGLSIASQACAIFLSQASEGMTLQFGHWIVSRCGVLGTMCASGVALAIHCGVLWAASNVWLMAMVHVTAGISHGCLWLAVRHNALLLATINDQEREAWVSWCSWRGGMGIGAMLWGSWAGGLSGSLKPLFAAAGAVAVFQAVSVSISCLLGRKQIRSRRRIYHTLDLDMEDDADVEDADEDEEDDWLVKRAKKEGITL